MAKKPDSFVTFKGVRTPSHPPPPLDPRMFFLFSIVFSSSLLKDHVFHNGFSELSRYKLASAYNDDSKQSDQRLSFSAEETLDPWLPKMRLSKTDQSAQTRICADAHMHRLI